jgi:hypothetical protein
MGYDPKYGKITLEKKPDIPDDEPLFVLRGQDKLAAGLVEQYAINRFYATGDLETTQEIMKQADAMRKWPVKKVPD